MPVSLSLSKCSSFVWIRVKANLGEVNQQSGSPPPVGSEGGLSSGKDSTDRTGQAVCQVAAPYGIGLCKVQGVRMVAACSS